MGSSNSEIEEVNMPEFDFSTAWIALLAILATVSGAVLAFEIARYIRNTRRPKSRR